MTRALGADFFVPVAMVDAVFHGNRNTLELPLPDGSRESFIFEPSGLVPDGFSYPIKTLRGRSATDQRCTASIVCTPDSMRAQIFCAAGVSYLNSKRIDSGMLRLEFAAESDRSMLDYQCLTAPRPTVERLEPREGMLRQQSAPSVHMLRTFRLAPGATAEFSEYFGSKEAAVLEVVTAMTRANEIFRRELGITFQLVPGFERMVFTDKATDPFSSNEPTEDLLKEAQAAFDSIMGTENYDLGIVLTRGTHGLAYIRGVCDPARKGSACIGLPEPAGDAFHVNLVTHELGHQFGANHTFNSPTGLCSERRHEWSAFEPGAGSTIMSYSSLPCGGDSFQPGHDAYFHSESIKEIREFIESAGVSCAALAPAFNSAPIIDAGLEHTIPVGTPFALTASGSDPEHDQISYCWEERDLGPAQTLGAPDNGLSPLFRSRPPTPSPTRIFPALEQVLAGTDSPQERLPQENRVLRFRVVARDSHDHGAVAWADTQIHVTNIAGPFRITSHTTAQTVRGSTRIEWNTGGTERAPVSAAQVRILLSTNGGLSFPIVLAAATANDGSEEIALPAINAANARLKVEPTNNIFFDVNDAPLTVAEGATAALQVEVAPQGPGRLSVSWPATVGARYRLERAGAMPPTAWSEVLVTNASGSSVSVAVPASAEAAYYRAVQE